MEDYAGSYPYPGTVSQVNILLLGRYEKLGASSRYRSYQYVPYLQQLGHRIHVAPLLSDLYLRRLYARQSLPLLDVAASYVRRVFHLLRSGSYDLIWIEYEALPWIPYSIESFLQAGRTPYLVDLDDAVFHRYDLNPSRLIRSILGEKIDRVMRDAALVIAGNSYLAERAKKAGASQVAILPTVVDLEKYPVVAIPKNEVFTVGWIGSPSTVHYLSEIRGALKTLSHKGAVRLVTIGADPGPLEGVSTEMRPWNEETEVEEMLKFDVGIMPLKDSPWERGKCGHKLIQYMACSRPVVASPVGVNREIVEHGFNGFLATGSEEWMEALSTLKANAPLRLAMGAAGRKKVEQSYCSRITAPRLASLLADIMKGRS